MIKIPFDQDLLPHSRLIIVHLGSSEECVHFQSSDEAKKITDSRNTNRLQDLNGHRSNKQTTKINQRPADHQAKGCVHPLDAEAGGKPSIAKEKEKKTTMQNNGSRKWPQKSSSDDERTTKFERIPNNIIWWVLIYKTRIYTHRWVLIYAKHSNKAEQPQIKV